MTTVTCYCDGACKGNSDGGWGFYYSFHKNNTEFYISHYDGEKNTTSPKMELLAVLNCLTYLPIYKNGKYIIFSDNEYVCKSIVKNGNDTLIPKKGKNVQDIVSGWLNKWYFNGWKKSNKKPIEHKDIMVKILNAMDRLFKNNITVTIKWIPRTENKEADRLANLGVNKISNIL
jgi:ribonuclease HI